MLSTESTTLEGIHCPMPPLRKTPLLAAWLEEDVLPETQQVLFFQWDEGKNPDVMLQQNELQSKPALRQVQSHATEVILKFMALAV